MQSDTELDRKRGTLLGLAIGDALGAAVEFQSPGSFPEVTGYRGGGPHGLAPGEWTDDTSMALALADSIARVGWDLNDQANRYVAWWKNGEYSVNGDCFDIGITTRSASEPVPEVGDASTSGDPSERASGNGSIMRLAPVPIRYASLFPDRLGGVGHAADRFQPTDPRQPAVHFGVCVLRTRVLCGLIRGVDREEVLAPQWKPLLQLKTTTSSAPRDCRRLLPVVSERMSRPTLPDRDTSWRAWRLPCGPSTTPRTFEKRSCGLSTLGTTPTRRVRSAGSWPGRTGASQEFRKSGGKDWLGRT